MEKWTILSRELLNALGRNHIRFFPKVKAGQRFLDTGALFEPGCQFPSTQTMPLGSYSYSLSAFGPCALIGRFCSIGLSVQVFGDHHPIERVSSSPVFYKRGKFKAASGSAPRRDMTPFEATPKPVTIGNDVWIGDNVTLRDGVHIGDGAVLAAGSLVTKDVAPYTIVGGNPARPIRERFPKEISDELMRVQWWRYDVLALQELPMENVEEFLSRVNELDPAQIVPERRMRLDDMMP